MRIVVITLLLFLTSCSTMRKKECESRQWSSQGYKDALKGYPASHYSKQKNACMKFNIPVNKDRYMDGFKKGIREFCTYKNGYEFGIKGKRYEDSCPKKLEEDFFKGYVAGKQQRSADKLLEEKED